MNRLIRFKDKLISFANRTYRESRKNYKEWVYDIQRMPKQRLLKIYNRVVFVTTLGSTVLYLVCNSYYLDKYMDWVQLKNGDTPLPLEDNLELLALREWNVCHIGRHYKLLNAITFFACTGSHPFSAGDLESRAGAIVGLPYNFTYNTVDDVNLKEMKIFGENPEILNSEQNSDLVQQVIESLVFSENAKKFAIARELHYITNARVITNCFVVYMASMVGVGLGQQVILSMRIRRRFALSIAIRLVSLSIGALIWFGVTESFKAIWEESADEEAVKQGPEYYAGAVEYYQKLLQRNSALYLLFETEAKDRFTKEGEQKGWFGSDVSKFRKRLKRIQELNPNNDNSKDESNKTEERFATQSQNT